MFVYEKGNSLNVTFKGSIPVENPEVVIKGYKNGASLTVNGVDVVSVDSPQEFEGKSETLVFQKDGKLLITFKGISGMNNAEVVLDEVNKGTVEAVVNGKSVTLSYDDEKVVVGGAVATTSIETPEEDETIANPDLVDPEEEVTED